MSNIRIRKWGLCALTLQMMAAACAPAPTEEDANRHGRVVAVVDGTEVSFRLEETKRPLRTLQVAVVLDGTRGASIAAAEGRSYDVVEAGLNDEPADSFQIVVADTRRLPLTDGELALLRLQENGSLTLGEAFAVTDEGERVTLQTEVR